MTFEEIQLILQQTVISQRESQQELQEFKEEVSRIVRSNDRTIQALLDQAATDRLRQEEERIRHEQRMEKLERMNEGLINLMSSIDDDRPTILRKLNTIETKVDTILDRSNRE